MKEIASGAVERQLRRQLIEAARRRQIDVMLLWRLDRWGRSVADLVSTLQELIALGLGFVSLTEALDLTTRTGRAMAGLLAVFGEFERETCVNESAPACFMPASKVSAWGAHHRSPTRPLNRRRWATGH